MFLETDAAPRKTEIAVEMAEIDPFKGKIIQSSKLYNQFTLWISISGNHRQSVTMQKFGMEASRILGQAIKKSGFNCYDLSNLSSWKLF